MRSVRGGAVARWLAVLVGVVGVVSCGSGDRQRVDPSVRVVELPGAAAQVDFDDVVYSHDLGRVLVPARQSGVYVVDPRRGRARRLGRLREADSVDVGGGRVFVLDRAASTVTVLDARAGRRLASFQVGAADYVRYLAARRELWVTEPAASPSGIEVFAVGPRPRRAGFIQVPGGPEALDFSGRRRVAYTHAGDDLVGIDIDRRTITSRWPTRCGETHGFPRVADRDGVVLASCAGEGKVVLFDLDNGREVDREGVGGGEALPAYSPATGHFYVRSDPGRKLATFTGSDRELVRVREVDVPKAGHCLTVDEFGYYWTCDPDRGRMLRFRDSRG